MDETSKKIATICECLDHCFSYLIWCDDFARHVDSEDMIMGLDRGHQLVSDATLLLSFLAIRKADEFLRPDRAKPDDLIANDVGLDRTQAIAFIGQDFLSNAERVSINKQVAHLTQALTPETDSEVDLIAIVVRSLPVFDYLVAEMRKSDKGGEAEAWLDKTASLTGQIRELSATA